METCVNSRQAHGFLLEGYLLPRSLQARHVKARVAHGHNEPRQPGPRADIYDAQGRFRPGQPFKHQAIQHLPFKNVTEGTGGRQIDSLIPTS